MPRPLRLVFPAAALVLATGLLLAQSLLSPAPASAQGSPPPFPYVLRGTVTLDGAPLDGSAMLTAQVGDWTSRPVEVIDGRFGFAPSQPLIVGPPNLDYIGETVTFHLRGLTADLSFTFEALPQPAFEDTELRFVSGASAVTPTPTAAPTPTASPAATPTAPRATPTATPIAMPTPTPAPEGGAGAGIIAGAAIGAVLALSLALWLLARRLGR
ncbi:MAG: hypothetical protein OXI25_07145 [Chloroflexota bacterium]|nr:hypothetical protein [Chloroflexota bacterium]